VLGLLLQTMKRFYRVYLDLLDSKTNGGCEWVNGASGLSNEVHALLNLITKISVRLASGYKTRDEMSLMSLMRLREFRCILQECP
jgi:hypothetical protein